MNEEKNEFSRNIIVDDDGDDDEDNDIIYRRQRGRVVWAQDLQFGGPEFKSRSDLYWAGFALSSPEFKSSATLVNSQLVWPRQVGILNPVKFNLHYILQAFARPH